MRRIANQYMWLYWSSRLQEFDPTHPNDLNPTPQQRGQSFTTYERATPHQTLRIILFETFSIKYGARSSLVGGDALPALLCFGHIMLSE